MLRNYHYLWKRGGGRVFVASVGWQRAPGAYGRKKEAHFGSAGDFPYSKPGRQKDGGPSEIQQECESINEKIIQPMNDRILGPLEKSSRGGYRTTKMPYVFLLGNHSSGKSSFINYCLGRNVQKAGVAPTDDSFTIISPDGPALVGDPDLGFGGLRQFGPALVHHTSLKIRSGIEIDDFMMVDSPGMIDSPVSRTSLFDSYSNGGNGTGGLGPSSTSNPYVMHTMDRGYDFEGVVRWLAERADVILLFFDPDKPGTTGETLSILTNALPGMDHKLYIILNKADRFERIADFARCYGSLCWNLSKVIQRKDLPRIYTMSLQIGDKSNVDPSYVDPLSFLGAGLQDLAHTRDVVRNEVLKAPMRRIDNIITRLTDSAHLLQVHATVLEALKKEYRSVVRKGWAMSGMTVSAGLATAAGTVYLNFPTEATVTVLGFAGAATLAVHFSSKSNAQLQEERLTSVEGLNRIFTKRYARELAEGDEWFNSVWKRIRDSLKLTVSTVGLRTLTSSVRKSDLSELQRIQDHNIPELRRKSSSPSHPTSTVLRRFDIEKRAK